MKNQKNLIIPAEAVALSRLDPDRPPRIFIGEKTLVVAPDPMTAMDVVNTISALTDVNTELLCALKDACGACVDHMKQGGCSFGGLGGPGECPYEGLTRPDATAYGAPTRAQRSGSCGERRSDGAGELFADRRKRASAVRDDAGAGPNDKLSCFVDDGEAVVTVADYEHDLTDVPENVRTMLLAIGVCPGRLNQLLMDGAEVWHG